MANLKQVFHKVNHLHMLFVGTLFLLLVSTLIIPNISDKILSRVFAATLTNADLTISDSRGAKTGVSYKFKFRVAGTTNIQTIRLQFCQGTTGACVAPTGLVTTSAALSVGFTLPGASAALNNTVDDTLDIGITTPSTPSTATTYIMNFTGITNPTGPNESFYVHVTTYSNSWTTEIDSTWVASAVLTSSSIAVTADIGPAFTFTVAGVNFASDTSGIGLTSTFVNATALNITTTENTIPFGSLTTGSTKVAAHDITVATNANNGYVVTVKYDDPDTSGAPLEDGSNNIDVFSGTNATPATWSSPAGVAASVDTGFFGYTTEDFTLGTGTAGRFSSNKWAGATTSPLELIYSATAPSGGTESKRIGWQAEINTLQPAGHYTGTVILVATPTY